MDCILVDREYAQLLDGFHPHVRRIVDEDCGPGVGEFEECIAEGLRINRESGGEGWDALPWEPKSEDDVIALAYTSGVGSSSLTLKASDTMLILGFFF